MFLATVFDAKVVYYQRETDGLPFVLPVDGRDFRFCVSCLEEACL